jgi:hypothetical protein
MAQPSTLLLCLYGVLFIVILYHIVHILYSVSYTPGVSTLYDSPITQTLFPSEKGKLRPNWGTDKIGLMKADPTKYGQGKFWPKSGKGFVPTKNGSGGPSPSGGERKGGVKLPVVLRRGYDQLPMVKKIYEARDAIPEKKVWPVGWWGTSS